MPDASTYLTIHVSISASVLQRQGFVGATRAERAEGLKDYLETLGLRPRHGGGALEWWDDPVQAVRHYRQEIPRHSLPAEEKRHAD